MISLSFLTLVDDIAPLLGCAEPESLRGLRRWSRKAAALFPPLFLLPSLPVLAAAHGGEQSALFPWPDTLDHPGADSGAGRRAMLHSPPQAATRLLLDVPRLLPGASHCFPQRWWWRGGGARRIKDTDERKTMTTCQMRRSEVRILVASLRGTEQTRAIFRGRGTPFILGETGRDWAAGKQEFKRLSRDIVNHPPRPRSRIRTHMHARTQARTHTHTHPCTSISVRTVVDKVHRP